MPPEEVANLRAVQEALFALITRPAPASEAVGAPGSAPDGRGAARPERLVVGDGRAGAAERVQVYAHMYRARIAEALESQFPRLARWLGPPAMADLAFAYITDQPSRNPSLRFVGQRLPAWLEQSRERAPWLADLARLEWARADVFDLVDQPLLTLDAVRAHPPERFAALPVTLIAAHRLVTTAHPIAACWDRVGAGAAIDEAAALGGRAGEALIVWRQEVSVLHRVVDDDERVALELAAGGTTFGALCDRLLLARDEEEAAAQAFRWLSTWIADGLLLDIPDAGA